MLDLASSCPAFWRAGWKNNRRDKVICFLAERYTSWQQVALSFGSTRIKTKDPVRDTGKGVVSSRPPEVSRPDISKGSHLWRQEQQA